MHNSLCHSIWALIFGPVLIYRICPCILWFWILRLFVCDPIYERKKTVRGIFLLREEFLRLSIFPPYQWELKIRIWIERKARYKVNSLFRILHIASGWMC